MIWTTSEHSTVHTTCPRHSYRTQCASRNNNNVAGVAQVSGPCASAAQQRQYVRGVRSITSLWASLSLCAANFDAVFHLFGSQGGLIFLRLNVVAESRQFHCFTS